MREADHSAPPDNGGGRSEADQRNHGRSGRNRRGAVQHNAQWALIGVAAQRIYVRHLHHGQQRQQDKA
jgi:hypothetical protein